LYVATENSKMADPARKSIDRGLVTGLFASKDSDLPERLADIDPELEQFAMNPGAPHRGLAMLISRMSPRMLAEIWPAATRP
jgi:hypothetical protein